MKTYLFILGMVLFIFTTIKAQDDMYFIPSKEVRQVKTQDGSVVKIQPKQNERARYYKEYRSVDDYNRRDIEPIDSSIVESSFEESDETSYPLTKIVMRFHSPHPGILLSSPYYWDICYSDAWDVYYDSWALFYPSYTWWSYAYDPWYYNRWHFRTCWDFTWGWYDPWYSHSYWGWGRPIYWGWSRPSFNPHHLGRPMYEHRNYGYSSSHRYTNGFGSRFNSQLRLSGVFEGRNNNRINGDRTNRNTPRVTRAYGERKNSENTRRNSVIENRRNINENVSNRSQRVETPRREVNSTPSFGSSSRVNGSSTGNRTSRGGGGFSRGRRR